MPWSLLDSGVAGFADGNAGHPYTFPGGTAGTNQLLVVGVSSDTTVSTPAGWSVGRSQVGNLGAYCFYKIAAGSESSVTITTAGNNNTAIGYLRYSGNATSSPLDKAASAQALSSSNTTTPAATTAALAQAGELSVAVACLGGLQGANQINPNWSAGYTARLDGKSAALGATDQHIFVGDNQNAGTAAQSPNVTWTNATSNQTMLVCTFLPGAAAAGRPLGAMAVSVAVHRAASW